MRQSQSGFLLAVLGSAIAVLAQQGVGGGSSSADIIYAQTGQLNGADTDRQVDASLQLRPSDQTGPVKPGTIWPRNWRRLSTLTRDMPGYAESGGSPWAIMSDNHLFTPTLATAESLLRAK